MRNLKLALAVIAALAASACPVLAQNEFKTPAAGKTVVGVQLLCQNGSAQAVPCGDATTPIQIAGSFSATLGGFQGNGNFANLTATAASSASTALPAGTTVRITNTSLTATVSCTLATGAATGLVSNIVIGPLASASRVIAPFDHIACIDQTGSTGSNVVVLEGGSGLGNDTGGGGGGSGGGGGAITIASGAVASGAYSSGSIASGAFASGSIGSGAMVDLGAIADAAATAGSTGTLSAKMRLMTTQLGTLNTTLGTPFQAGGSIGNTTFAATQATAASLNATVVGTGTFAVQLTGATNNINNISGTISLPTGAGTAANQTAINNSLSVNTLTAAHTCSIAGYSVASCLGQIDDDAKGPLTTQASTVSIGGVGLFSGGTIMSATNGIYSNLLQGNAVISATNGLYANLMVGNAAVATGTGAQGATVPRVTVATDQATNAGAALVKGGVGTVNGGSTWNTVAASQTAQVLSSTQAGGTGAVGDYLSHCVIQPATTSPGVVTVFDGTNTATNDAISFPGGASSVSNLVPFAIPVGAVSVNSGGWKVTTTTNVTVSCYGKFT